HEDADRHCRGAWRSGKGVLPRCDRVAKSLQELRNRCVASIGLFLETPHDDGIENRRRRNGSTRSWRWRRQMHALELDGIRGLEWRVAHQKLVHEDAERVDVRARIDAVAADLLGRHGVRSSESGARRREAPRVGVALQKLRDSEVEQLDDALIAAM